MNFLRKRLTAEQIREVRNNIIGLYLAPGEHLEVAAPKNPQHVKRLLLFGGSIPCIEFSVQNSRVRFWLKCQADQFPHWDLQVDEGEVVRLPFYDVKAQIPRALVKAYASHFPFLPTNNYLQNNGDFVA